MRPISRFFVLLALLQLCYATKIYSVEAEEVVKRSDFPDGFLFGTSTSAYQVEGAYLEDGKGLNNWDVFTHIQGKVVNNDNGDVADDHYHLFVEDIDLMSSLGVNSYRFSISWTRILPKGRFGEVNTNGIRFYNNIINYLLLKGIEPFVTIFHHAVPQELVDRYNSWLSPLIQEDFLYLARICFENFGDRVKYWTTLNEPNLVIEMTYINGWFPPGPCSPFCDICPSMYSNEEPLTAHHNMLLSHAKAVKLYRETFQEKQGGCIGIVASAQMFEPLRDNELDREAVNRTLKFKVSWTLDPLVYGDYPPEMHQYLGKDLPKFTLEETEYIKGSVDFIGINHYTTLYAMDCLHSPCNSSDFKAITGFSFTTAERDGAIIGEPTGMRTFYVVPRGMQNMIDFISKRYNNIPLYVTENGYSTKQKENESLESLLHDKQRMNFHQSYLAALVRSIRNGADVRGYFVWSLMDNLEWLYGYSIRFGLYHVDRKTLKRIPRLSAKWFKSFLNNDTTVPGLISST